MKIAIRKATLKDAPALRRLIANMGRRLEAQYFEECLVRAAAGERDFYLAQKDGSTDVAGYVMLVREPRYQPFRRMKIPEIQDLSVDPDLRQQGIGSQLVTF
ncbi:MAG: GNAT family N-acetyltransferase, partial [Pseudomonadota bacterium]